MALGMKAWLGMTTTACALAAVTLLPLEPYAGGPEGLPPTQEGIRNSALLRDVVRSRQLLRRMRVTDTLSSLLSSGAGQEVVVGVLGGDVGEEAWSRFQEGVAGEVRAIPGRRNDVALGVFVVPGSMGDHPDAADLPDAYSSWPEYYLRADSADGIASCWVVKNTRGAPSNRSLVQNEWEPFVEPTRRHTLGPCWWVAVLGPPSAATARWLAAGAYTFAMEPAGRDELSEVDAFQRRRSLFGLSFLWFTSGRLGLIVDGCLAARAESCAELFAGPGGGREPSTALTDIGYLGGARTYASSFERSRRLLADLEEEFGRERLRAFWTADADPPTAFREAFGMEAGAWMAAWVRRGGAHVPPGPLPTASGLLGSLAVLLLGAALAVLAGRRRSVTR